MDDGRETFIFPHPSEAVLPLPSGDSLFHRSGALSAAGQTGSILMVTIWVVLVLAGLALVFARSMRVESIASANYIAGLKTEEIAKGAISFVRSRLTESDETLKLDGETPYRKIQVGDGYFWLLRPSLENDDTYYYGIRDESSRMNLNTANEAMLLKLPGMTTELADSIIDWRDADSDITGSGAEDEYYLLLSDPYYCKNGDFESIDEVLLVKGASQELLYGEDWNLNGVLDPNENDGDVSPPQDNRNGVLDRGFYDYVTVFSKSPNVNSSGAKRIDINNDAQSLYQLLGTVVGQNKAYEMRMDLSGVKFSSILDFYYQSGLTEDQFKQIADKISISSDTVVPGLINVNTAPKKVLMCLPGLDESDAEALIDKRNSDSTDTDSLAWVTEVLTKKKATAIGPYITTQSCRYSADIVGVSGDGRSFCRYEMVVDTQNDGFKIIFWKSLKYLGWPLDPQILTKLRSGETLE